MPDPETASTQAPQATEPPARRRRPSWKWLAALAVAVCAWLLVRPFVSPPVYAALLAHAPEPVRRCAFDHVARAGTRHEVAYWLSSDSRDRLAPDIAGALASSDLALQAGAAPWAVGLRGEVADSCLDGLVKALSNPDWRARLWALVGLRRDPARATPHAIACLSDPDARVRHAAVGVLRLAPLDDAAVDDALEEAAAGPDPAVQRIAALALEERSKSAAAARAATEEGGAAGNAQSRRVPHREYGAHE
jgi:hypothetical protein